MSTFGLVLLAAVAVANLATGLPAYLVLLVASVVGAAVGVAGGAIPFEILRGVAGRLFALLENDLLQALPLFLLMGALLNRLPVTDALFRCGTVLFGGARAAPVLSGFLLGGLLGPMNGSVGASVGALARTLGPRLASSGVDPARKQAVVAVAGTLGVVVPPSLVLILLGDALLNAHTLAINATKRADRVINTQDLMRGALVPAAIFLVLCLLIARLSSRRGPPMPATERPSLGEVLTALAAVVFLLAMLGGIATGRFYAVEAAAMGATALFVAAVLTGRLAGGGLGKILDTTFVGTGTLFAPLAAATTFTLVLRLLGTDKLVEAWITALPDVAAITLAVVLGALLVLAFALDAFEIIFVGVPILVPAMLIRVDDAVWVGVLVLFVLQTSFLLPPLGYAFVLTRSALPERTGAIETLRALAPYLAGQIAVLTLVLAVPALVHALDPPGSRGRGPADAMKPADVDAVFRSLPQPSFGAPGIPGLTPPVFDPPPAR